MPNRGEDMLYKKISMNSAFGISFIFHCILIFLIGAVIPCISFGAQSEIMEIDLVSFSDIDGAGGGGGGGNGLPPAPVSNPISAVMPIRQSISDNEGIAEDADNTLKEIQNIPSMQNTANVNNALQQDSSVGAAGSGIPGGTGIGTGSGSGGGNGSGHGGGNGSGYGPGSGGGFGGGTGGGAGGGLYPPRVLNTVEPDYPENLRAEGIEGTVQVKSLVLADGSVGDCWVVKSSGYQAMDNAALRAVRLWQFVPAKQRSTGIAVECYTKVDVVFRLR